MRPEQPFHRGGAALGGAEFRGDALTVDGIVGEDGPHPVLPQQATQHGSLIVDAQATLRVEQAHRVGAGSGDAGSQRQEQNYVSDHTINIADQDTTMKLIVPDKASVCEFILRLSPVRQSRPSLTSGG